MSRDNNEEYTAVMYIACPPGLRYGPGTVDVTYNGETFTGKVLGAAFQDPEEWMDEYSRAMEAMHPGPSVDELRALRRTPTPGSETGE